MFASALVTPGLTTVAAPLNMLGDAAVRHIVAALRNNTPADAAPVVVPVRLVVRDSCGAPS